MDKWMYAGYKPSSTPSINGGVVESHLSGYSPDAGTAELSNTNERLVDYLGDSSTYSVAVAFGESHSASRDPQAHRKV